MSLQKIYSKDYYYSGKRCADGYCNYDTLEKQHPWEFTAEKILSYKKGGRLLDVGCAFGTLLNKFPDSFEKYGSDISEFAIARAKENYPEIKFAAADVSVEKPFKEKFDIITAFDVMEHVLDLRSALRNVHGMMKEDGVFLMGVPVATRLHHLFAALGFSFLTNQPSHLTLTKPGTWREIILPEHFEIAEENPYTWSRRYVPGVELFRLFILKKK